MASITIEIPDKLAQDLEVAGLLDPKQFVAAIMRRLAEQQNAEFSQTYTAEEMLAAVEEGYGILADADWTMDDILAMKREERELEERKYNRLS